MQFFRDDGDGRRGHPADRLLQRPGRPRPGHPRRVVPDRRHLRPDARRRHRRDRPRLRADLRQPGVAADRHRERRDRSPRTPRTHADLFWACRGGGGGNFGVVTSFTFSTHPAPTPVLFFLSWPWSQAAKVVAAWQSWAPHAPDAMWSNLHLAAAPGGRTPTIQVGGCYLGSIGGAANLLDQLYAKVGSHPSGYFLNQFSYLNAMLLEAGCSSIGYQACHLPWYVPRRQAEPPAAVRQVRLLHQAAEQRRDRHPAARHREPAAGARARRAASAASRSTPSAARSTGSRRPRPPSCTGTPCSAPSTPPTGPTARPRPGVKQPARLAAVVLDLDAPLRQRPGLPELHRPGPDQLAARPTTAPTTRACSRSRRPTTPPASSPSPRPSSPAACVRLVARGTRARRAVRRLAAGHRPVASTIGILDAACRDGPSLRSLREPDNSKRRPATRGRLSARWRRPRC